jgi:hypothetical protein
MTLNALAIAQQGFNYSPVMVAVQGLIAFLEAGGSTWLPIYYRRRRRM